MVAVPVLRVEVSAGARPAGQADLGSVGVGATDGVAMAALRVLWLIGFERGVGPRRGTRALRF